MTEKFAVIGLGHFGIAVARQLAKKGAEVLAIDIDHERVDMIKDDVAYAVALDSTDPKALASQSVADMDAVLVAIGENTEGLLLTTVHLLEMKVKKIIARAMTSQQRTILNKLGVDEILAPEDQAGIIVAESLINPHKKAYLPLPDNYEIVDLVTPVKLLKKSLGEIGFERNYSLKLITIKRLYEEYVDGDRFLVEHLIRHPNEDTVLQPNDELILLGTTTDVEKLIEINS